MNLLSPPTIKPLSLLSIGHRGVGKTVFLAGSYAELHTYSQSSTQPDRPFWFECQDSDVQENLEKILCHVQQTGLYPPATIKITSFNFNLKRQTIWGTKTLCHFRWWDIPGETCNIDNPDFQEMVLASQGCCVFISADALVHNQTYASMLEDLFNQVVAIASLSSQRRLNYAFALVLTKCDLLQPGAVTQLKIEENLQPLMTRLDAVKANYQRFYSAIPIVSMEGIVALKARGAAAPLLWLLSELNQHHRFQPATDLGSGLSQNLSVGQVMSPALRRYVVICALFSVGILGAIVSLLLVFKLLPNLPERSSATEQSQQIKQIYRITD